MIADKGLETKDTIFGTEAYFHIVIELVYCRIESLVVFRSSGVAGRETSGNDTFTPYADMLDMLRCFIDRTRVQLQGGDG